MMVFNIRGTLAAILTALTLGVLVMLSSPQPAQATFPGKNGKLAFERNNQEIWTMNPDGSGLTKVSAWGYDPAFSPDGTMIAFNQAGIKIMNSDGTNVQRVSSTEGYNLAWSPDGKRLAYNDLMGTTIYTMNANGTDVRKLTAGMNPDWSPDGTKIAFDKAVAGGNDIFTIPVSGGTPTRLTYAANNPGNIDGLWGPAYDPSWSPDGTKIAFHCMELNGSDVMQRIFTVPASGGTPTRYTNNTRPVFRARFSPSGTAIAYKGDAGNGNYKLYINGAAVPNSADVIDHDWGPTGVPPLDKVAPKGTVKINKGATSTSTPLVKLSLSGNDPIPGNGVRSMRIKNDGGSWSAWQPYATSKSWTLRKASGIRTVYVQYRDRAGNVSTTALDRITLNPSDTVKPTISAISPKPGSMTNVRTPTIKATVTDNITNLRKANIKLYVNGSLVPRTKYSYYTGNDKLIYNPPKFTKDKASVKIVATDAAGNVGARSWTFWLSFSQAI